MGEVAIENISALWRLIPTPGAGFTFTPDHSRAQNSVANLPSPPPSYYSLLVETNACKRRLGFWQNSRQHTTCRVVSNQWLE